MAGPEDVFHAKISATDDASSTIERIKTRVHALGEEFHHAGERSEHLHHPHVFAALTEHIHVLGEHVHGLNMSFGEVGGSISELLPAFAAFGAAGSLVGLFETVEHVSEAFSTLSHTAQEIGTTTQALHDLHIVADLFDTNIEGMDKSLGKFSKTLGEVKSGKNADAAALFKHLRIDPKQFHNSSEALLGVADAFMHTKDAEMRTRMAFALFGKAGGDLIPMLSKGKEALRETQVEAEKLGYHFSKLDAEHLDQYDESIKKLRISVGGFTDELGSGLAPVLLPIVDHAREWVLAHRAGLADFVVGKLKTVGDWAEEGGLERAEKGVERFGDEVDHVVQMFGGWGRAAELLAGIMVVKGALFLYEPIAKVAELSVAIAGLVIKLGTELVGAWTAAGTAAEAAGAKELAAAEAGAAAGHGAVGANVAGGAVGVGNLMRVGAALAVPFAGGFIAHEVDSGDHVGKFIDAHIPGAGAVDDFISRHTFGDNGREGGRFTPHQLAAQQRAAAEAPDDLGLPFSGDASEGAAGRVTVPRFDTLPEIHEAAGSAAPARVDGEVKVTVDLQNAPPGTTATATTRGNNMAQALVNTGQAWLSPF